MPGAQRGAVGKPSQRGAGQADDHGNRNKLRAYQPRDPRREQEQHLREQASKQTANYPDDEHCGPRSRRKKFQRQDAPEVNLSDRIVVADKDDANKARHHHRAHNDAEIAFVEAAPDFLEGKNQTGDRRIESCGDSGGAAGHDQSALGEMNRKPHPAPGQMHETRAELHRGTLASDGKEGEQAQRGEQRLSRGHTRRKEPIAKFPWSFLQRRDGLRNSRAVGPGENMITQP